MVVRLRDEEWYGQIIRENEKSDEYDDKVKVYYDISNNELKLKSGDVNFFIPFTVINEIINEIKNDSNIKNYELVRELVDTLRRTPPEAHNRILRDFENMFLKEDNYE